MYTMMVLRNHPTALTRQIEESVALDKMKVHVLMNSKGEWNSQSIPRIVVQVRGRDEEEEGDRLPTVESWASPVRYKSRRRSGEEVRAEMPDVTTHKRRRVGDSPVGEAAKPEAAGGEGGQQPGEAEQGEVDKPEQRQPAAPLPVRVPQAKVSYRKTSSRGKKAIVDPRQKSIKFFFQNKNAEETGKLESGDRLEMASADAGQSGAAAGVGPQQETGLSLESENRNSKENN